MEINASFQNQNKLMDDKRKRRMDGKLYMYAGCNIKDARIPAQHKNSYPVKNTIQSLGKVRST